jgi:aminoglycoside/choline kinase family phosphotransferase
MAATDTVVQVAATVPTRQPEEMPGLNRPEFLDPTPWRDAVIEPIAGDASDRRYFRLRHGHRTAVLMDASRNRESIDPFLRIDEHLIRLGFSAPVVLARDPAGDCLLLEDFGDATFGVLLDGVVDPAPYLELATDVLAALHGKPDAVPPGLRRYDVETMLADIELFLEWCVPELRDEPRAEFRSAWRQVLPLAHRVQATLLLRDYHAGNLMFLARRQGVRRAGLLDFQDAYQGPVTYDLVSLLEDARRDVPHDLRQGMIDRYLAKVPVADREAFATSLAAVAAQRHTRVLAIFERLHRNGRPEYRERHSPRVRQMLHRALAHPALTPVRRWMQRYAG